MGYFKSKLIGLETPEPGDNPIITHDLEKLAAQLDEHLLGISTHSTNVTAEPGEICLMTLSGSVTSPPATVNTIFGAIATQVPGTTVKFSTGACFGDFLSETGVTEVHLRKGQHCIFMADGTNWRLIAGEPAREESFVEASVVRNSKTSFVASEVRPTVVYFNLRNNSIKLSASVSIKIGKDFVATYSARETSNVTGTFYVLPGQSWEWTLNSGEPAEVSASTTYQLL
jgi:hypothetical protein